MDTTFDQGDPAVVVRDLWMTYGQHHVLRGIDLTVQQGEVITLLGPNGAGKTTTIEILEGFRKRTAGTVQVLGADPERGDEAWRSRVGVVFQSWRDHGKWRVRELLTHAARFYEPWSTPDRRRPRDVDDLLVLVGLHDLAGQRIRTLSGGQRRRLDVALALVGHPELLFLDEPTAGFDPHARRDFHDLVHRLTDLDSTTVVMTTHDLHEAEQLADHIVILATGTIVAEGSADHLARMVGEDAEVRWRVEGVGHVHVTRDATAFVEQLHRTHGDAVTDLQVTRASLEETYLRLVHDAERAAEDAVDATHLQVVRA